MCRLFPCIPIFGVFCLLKRCEKWGCVCVIALKSHCHLLFMFFNSWKGDKVKRPARTLKYTLLILQSDIDPGYIHWTLTSFQLEKFEVKVSEYLCYIFWESHSTKIIVARILKLTVMYICINESVWHPNTELRFFRIKFVKRLGPAEKFIFQIM